MKHATLATINTIAIPRAFAYDIAVEISKQNHFYHGKRRWNYFKEILERRFGCVVYKIGVDAGFDCPNRDGTKGFGGCAYCSQSGSLSAQQDPRLAIADQIERGRSFVSARYGAKKFIVYFQAFTNTYAPVSVLRERYEAALGDPAIIGLSIASRPDCIDEANAAYMAELVERLPYFTVELGLQSAFQNRLQWVNRQETVDDYLRAMEILRRHRVPVISHVILGFPGESVNDMETTVRLADREGSQGIKLQMLHVIKGTKLAAMYKREPFTLFSMEEYGNVVIHMLERVRPDLEIHRITGETDKENLIAPLWVRHKTRFFDWIDREMQTRNTWQGRLVNDYCALT